MKIDTFTDKVAEKYGSTDEQTIVNEGAAFIADLVSGMQKQIQTKVGANVRLTGDEEAGSVLEVGPVELLFRKHVESPKIEVLVSDETEGKNGERFDVLEVPEGQAALISTRFHQELSKDVFEKYLNVFRHVV
ncbi:hypothetical protein SAMN05421781_0339 [Marinococcus luteus]|uniref:Uncharacterized protein n=1 Tax=Marinococcus luteus TaxID=1122204 RepID=A0A1H2QIQ8_9BACI|nr:hypothetical protein [Marinococcus luteus]SDW07052.1 hypothetical protein SAMN05421781_0339 [Marinococcus luteus]